MKINITTDIRYAFFYFFVVVCLGVFLRFTFIFPIPFEYNYRYVLHAHSHTAFLGWIYVLLSALISREFISIAYQKQYRRLFYATQITIVGMLFSFLMQGYSAFSIAFSSVFVLLSYCFGYLFLKKSTKESKEANYSYLFIKMGVFYLILSSLGIWGIPFSIIEYGKNSELYQASIAFFLHFQYNGWMCSTLMGLFIRKFQWEKYYPELIKKIFYLFQIAAVGTLVVSWLGIFPLGGFYLAGGFFTMIWLVALGTIGYLYFYRNKEKTLLGSLFLLFFILKIGAMLIGILLGGNKIFNNPDLIISYLHLNFLGIVNLGLLFFLEVYKLFTFGKLSIYLYLLAFFLSEILIAYKGLFLWFDLPSVAYYFHYLAFGSSLFVVVALYWLIGSVKVRKT